MSENNDETEYINVTIQFNCISLRVEQASNLC